jgi:hypothetical protein
MTPKEKAIELVEIYKKQVSMNIKDYSLVCKVLDNDMSKQCALICINEMIRICYDHNMASYYGEVKQEILKL